MIRVAAFAVVAPILFGAVPAAAADTIYSGTLHGIINDGSAEFYNYITEDHSTIDLVGRPITIKFFVDAKTNYTNPDFSFFPKFDIDTVKVLLPPETLEFQDIRSTSSTFDYYPPYGYADYSGDAHGAVLDHYGFYAPDPDFSHFVNFNFSGASPVSGPITGTGTASAFFYNPYGGQWDKYSISYTFTKGNVIAAIGTPEPQGWVLLIVGFGAVGSVMRRQYRRNSLPLAG